MPVGEQPRPFLDVVPDVALHGPLGHVREDAGTDKRVRLARSLEVVEIRKDALKRLRRSGGWNMSPEAGCRTIHALIGSLPAFEEPAEVTITDGLYFFYEDGESAQHAPAGRIVRVGNHPRSDGTLVRRLRQHYKGHKNGSVFRKFLGGALMRSEDPSHPCLAPAPGKGHWEKQDEKTCDRCKPVEQGVSRLLSTRFRFRCVSIPLRQERNRFEKALIATLSSCPLCQPSREWLGYYTYSDVIRRAGMWNSHYVSDAPMSAGDLEQFADYVASTPLG